MDIKYISSFINFNLLKFQLIICVKLKCNNILIWQKLLDAQKK